MNFTFLMCSERSGSNLITKIIDRHSQYCGPSPIHLFRLLLENYSAYGDLTDYKNWERLIADALSLFCAKLGLWKTDWHFEQLVENISTRSLKQLLKIIYETETRSHQKSHVFVKENHIYRFLPFIQSSFPEAKFIYLVRDPRDMALSWKKAPSLRGSVIRATRVWKMDQSNGLNILAQLQGEKKIKLIRYEDLLKEPVMQLKTLCKFLAIDFEPTMIEFHSDPYTNRNAGCAAEWQNLQKPLLKDNYNKYINELTEEEIRYIEGQSVDHMKMFGYKPLYGPTDDLEELKRAVLPYELYEKPDYLKLPESERRARAKQNAVFKQVRIRQKLSVLAN